MKKGEGITLVTELAQDMCDRRVQYAGLFRPNGRLSYLKRLSFRSGPSGSDSHRRCRCPCRKLAISVKVRVNARSTEVLAA